MKHLFSLVFAFICVSCYAQEPSYTPMRLNYQFRGVKVDSLFLVPSYTDTTQANTYTAKNIPGSLIRTGSDFWMRNGTATAWLQNVNVGPGSSPSVQFVDSVWRVNGKDSIFWRKGGVTNKIKDSLGTTDTTSLSNRINLKQNQLNGTGFVKASGTTITYDNSTYKTRAVDTLYRKAGKDSIFWMTNGTEYRIKDSVGSIYAGDSPDRIDGRASADVIADMFGYTLYIQDAEGIKCTGIKNDVGFQFDTDGFVIENADTIDLGSTNITKLRAVDGTRIKAGDFTNADKIGNVLYNRANSNVTTNAAHFQCNIPGVFTITSASLTYEIRIPDAASFPGQMVVIINTDTNDSGLGSSGGTVYDRGTGATLTQIDTLKMGTFFSDGDNWYGFIL